jgi:hypothetical protein
MCRSLKMYTLIKMTPQLIPLGRFGENVTLRVSLEYFGLLLSESSYKCTIILSHSSIIDPVYSQT